MTDETPGEVKEFVERVEVTPAPEEGTDTPPASSQAEKVTPKAPETAVEERDPRQLPGETAREFGMRLQIESLRKRVGDDLHKEILPNQAPPTEKQSLSAEKQEILKKYKPEEISALKEVVDVLAEDMGFVRKDQLGASNYAERANDEFNSFISAHKEYAPENDKDGLLWEAFKREYNSGLYNKVPTNPKDFRKIFEKVHKEVFKVEPRGNAPLNEINANKEKVKVASHIGASTPQSPRTEKQNTTGVRLDMLKGFSPEEIEAMG